MRSPRPHGPGSRRNLLGSAHSHLVTPIAFPEVVWRVLCCVPHQRQQCLCHPRSRLGSFNPEKLKVTSFVCVFVPAGQKILHHRSDVLETVVLINPSDEAVSTEVSIQLRAISGRPSHSGQDQLIGGAGADVRRGTLERKVPVARCFLTPSQWLVLCGQVRGLWCSIAWNLPLISW